MSGSMRKFRYTSDDGNVYQVSRDESNTEIVNAGAANINLIPMNGQPKLPTGYECRYAMLYQVNDPQIKRKVLIVDPAKFSTLTPSTDFSLQVVGAANANFRISALIGEKRTNLTLNDTGQLDGDAELAVVV